MKEFSFDKKTVLRLDRDVKKYETGGMMMQNKSSDCIGNLKEPVSELGISDTFMDIVKFLKYHGECSNLDLVVDDFHHESKNKFVVVSDQSTNELE